MSSREDTRVDLPVDEDVPQDPVPNDAAPQIGEEIDPDSIRPMSIGGEDEEFIDDDDDDVRRGL